MISLLLSLYRLWSYKLSWVLILSIFASTTSFGQNMSKYRVPQNMKFSSIELQIGYYKPRLYSYNEVYFDQFTEGKFQGSRLIAGALTYRLIDEWYIKGGLSHWGERVQTETIIISDQPVYEKVKLNMLMAELAAVYDIKLYRHFYIQGGFGAIIARMTSDHQRVIGESENSFLGTSYPIMAVGFGSLNYTLDGYLDFGVQLKAIYGRSNHFVADFGEMVMSTAGPEASIRIAYNFQNRWFFRKSHGAFRNHDSRSY